MRVVLFDAYVDDAGSRRFFLPLMPEGSEVVRLPWGDAMPDLDAVDAVVVSGSKASANDPEPWVVGARGWLRQALAADVPVLGVCFGHQLLAAAAGAPVVRRPLPEVGFLDVTLHEDPVLDALGEGLVPFLSHGDEVVADPSITVLGRSAACAVQAFRVPGRRAWGVQFHLEYDREEQARIVAGRAADYPALGLDPDVVMAQAVDTRPAAHRLVQSFLSVAGAR